jgi:thiol:disulfide interchange protein DsbC
MNPVPPPAGTYESSAPAVLGALVVLVALAGAAVVASRTVPQPAGFVTQPAQAVAATVAGDATGSGPEVIAANLAQRLPGFPKIDEVRATPVAGLYEVRVGSDVLYTDARADHVIQGQIVDTRTRENLTEARLERLSAIDFSALPLADAFVIRQGAGSRKLVVFADPNCGYCKRLERDLVAIDDVTVYTFLYPILGPDSRTKSRDVWCAADPGKVWRDWMIDGVVPAAVDGACDTGAIERTLALGQRMRVQGTPALFFEDGTRKPGALPRAQVEQLLAAAAGKS